jgi:hypothetical protein
MAIALIYRPETIVNVNSVISAWLFLESSSWSHRQCRLSKQLIYISEQNGGFDHFFSLNCFSISFSVREIVFKIKKVMFLIWINLNIN